MDLISDISNLSKNYLSLDNLVYQILQLSENGERDFTSLTNNPSVRVALLDFYNDVKRYKEALTEIKNLQKNVARDGQNESNYVEEDKIQSIDSLVVQKYSLLRPTALFNKKKYRVDIETRKLQSCSLKRRESKCDSDTSAESGIVFKQRAKAIPSVKSAKSIMKPASEIKILVAEPNVIEFYNCDPGLKYKKTVVVRNIHTQMARFRIEKRPDKTAFDIFVQSMTGGDKGDVAPGMYVKIIVQYTCDPLAEPNELLVLSVKNGTTVPIEIKAHRDPPILQVGTFAFIGSSSQDTFSSSEIASSTNCSNSSEVKSSSSESSSEEKMKNETGEVVRVKLSNSDTRELSVDSNLPCGGTAYASLDCKKCFVGELVIISTTLKNVGGNGRFFIMSELDWCSMRIVDMTRRNKLIVTPFAIWPAYFQLQANEELTICIYFFPDSYGLQVDELYIVSDNCSLKTIEIMGDGIMLEPQMFEFDKSIKYQWFESENGALCTLRYLDLNYDLQTGLFTGAFVITCHCDLSVYYRWEKCNRLLCPAEYKNTIMRKDLDLDRFSIAPDKGVFQQNSSILFKVTATTENLPFDHYRSLLSLIIEDIPCAAVPSRFNYSYTKTKVDRRLCDNTVDVVFQEIEIRIKHTQDESCTERFKHEETLLTASIMNITDYTNTTFTLTNQFALIEPSESSSSVSEDVCRLLKGYGTCDCCRTIITSTAVLRPGRPLFVGVEESFTVSLINKTNKRLKFWWGNIIGPDHTKLKINIEPKFDLIFPEEPYTVTIKCFPLETGVISSLFIPCQFDGINPVNLSIECTIVSLSVAFYFPLECQENLFIPANLRIEWDSSEYISKYDKKTCKVRLFKQKIKEEKIVHDIILNSSESLKKTSSSDSSECEEGALTCETFSEIHSDRTGDDQISDVTTLSDLSKTSWLEERESCYYNDYLPVLPYVDFRYNLIKKHFRYLPLIIEIHVNFQKTTRMRVYLENLSPISSDFVITTRNLWDKNEIHSDNSEFSEIMSGMVLTIEPMSGKIMPSDITFFEIVANSNTWGIYTDKITVNIDLLPSFSFWVRIINDNLPISYPICKNSSIKIPKIRFQIFKRDCVSGSKKLLLENTSNIPLYVNWHCFLLTEEEKPFNLIFDMFSPFISMDEYLATNTSLYDLIKKYFSCAFNAYKSKDQLTEIDEYMETRQLNDNFENEFNDGFTDNAKTEPSTSATGNTSKVLQNSNDFPLSSNNLKVSSKLKDVEFQLSIVPYYGKPDFNAFNIKPVELFLPPKQKRYVEISVNLDKVNSSQKKIQCRACGFIRIPPIFRYKDNAFYRKDGHYLPPTQVLLECVIRKPKFILQSNRLQRTFNFQVTDFFLLEKTELKAKRKIAFVNLDEDVLEVQFVISKPFQIGRVSTLRERCIGANVNIHPNENLELELKCVLDKSWVDKAEDYRRKGSQILTFVELKRKLLISFRQGFSEKIEVFIKIIFPSLKISENNINFGEIEIGQVTSATFNIYNLAERSQTFEIRENIKYCKNRIFTFYPRKALIAAQSVREMNMTEVKVSFVPKYPGNFEKVVEIISEIDGLVSKFSLKGVAIKSKQF